MLMLLALSMVVGALLATAGSVALGGVTTAVTGISVAVFGPVAPGIVGVVGGILLYVSADEQRRTPRQAPEPDTTEPQRSPLLRS